MARRRQKKVNTSSTIPPLPPSLPSPPPPPLLPLEKVHIAAVEGGNAAGIERVVQDPAWQGLLHVCTPQGRSLPQVVPQLGALPQCALCTIVWPPAHRRSTSTYKWEQRVRDDGNGPRYQRPRHPAHFKSRPWPDCE